jgi:hypothetical protein
VTGASVEQAGRRSATPPPPADPDRPQAAPARPLQLRRGTHRDARTTGIRPGEKRRRFSQKLAPAKAVFRRRHFAFASFLGHSVLSAPIIKKCWAQEADQKMLGTLVASLLRFPTPPSSPNTRRRSKRDEAGRDRLTNVLVHLPWRNLLRLLRLLHRSMAKTGTRNSKASFSKTEATKITA